MPDHGSLSTWQFGMANMFIATQLSVAWQQYVSHMHMRNPQQAVEKHCYIIQSVAMCAFGVCHNVLAIPVKCLV